MSLASLDVALQLEPLLDNPNPYGTHGVVPEVSAALHPRWANYTHCKGVLLVPLHW